MNILMTNIDDIRARTMQLENLEYFDQQAWESLLMDLKDYPCRLADIRRRMQSARERQAVIGSCVDFSISANIA